MTLKIILSILLFIFCIFIQTNTAQSENSNSSNSRQDVNITKIYNENDTNSFTRSKKGAIADKSRLWDNGIIPYELDYIFTKEEIIIIKRTMRHWENYTCIQFVEKSDEHINYIFFTQLACGCCSYIGKLANGQQPISLGQECRVFGAIVHELGHAIGFWHEHSRPDRDQHVKVFMTNVKTEYLQNFRKRQYHEVDSLGEPYDFNSIMHYGRRSYAIDTYKHTILPHGREDGKRPRIGQRKGLSESDIIQTNLLYNCPVCGYTLHASSGQFQSPYKTLFQNGKHLCEWRISVAKGETITLSITLLSLHKDDYCTTDFLEIYDGYWDKSPFLRRYCGISRWPFVVTSASNHLLVKFQKMSEKFRFYGFKAAYKTNCGGNFVLSKYNEIIIATPNYPENYGENRKCTWVIEVPLNYSVAITVETFNLEYDLFCKNDYVEFSYANNTATKSIERFCGIEIPKMTLSDGNKMMIKFVSDHDVGKSGFSFRIFAEIDECATQTHGCEHTCINKIGGYHCECDDGHILHWNNLNCLSHCERILNEPHGVITSPKLDKYYDQMCKWEIIVPKNLSIILNFTRFDVGKNKTSDEEECEEDYVEVNSLYELDIWEKFGLFCGSKLPEVIFSESNILEIIFQLQNVTSNFGFSAYYYTKLNECEVNNGGCGQICHNTINSPNCSCYETFELKENGRDCGSIHPTTDYIS